MCGAVYYALALVNLMRGGADAELYWMGTDAAGPHGLWDDQGGTTPTFRAKELIAQTIRSGDEILVSDHGRPPGELTLVGVRRPAGERATVIIHAAPRHQSYRLARNRRGGGFDVFVLPAAD